MLRSKEAEAKAEVGKMMKCLELSDGLSRKQRQIMDGSGRARASEQVIDGMGCGGLWYVRFLDLGGMMSPIDRMNKVRAKVSGRTGGAGKMACQ
jgi:hypothetical protein